MPPTTSEAPLFYFWSFRQRQKPHFSIFGAFDNVRSSAFLFLVLSTMSEAPLFYFWCFRQRQKHHFSIFGASDNVRSITFLFLELPTMSEASLFYFWCFRQCQKHHFSIFGASDNVRSSAFLFPKGVIAPLGDYYPSDRLLPSKCEPSRFPLILNDLIPSGNYSG